MTVVASAPVNRRRVLLLAATLLWLAGCNTQGPTTTPPEASPSAPASVVPSAAPVASMNFRDDFDGTAIDESRWKVFRQSGVVAVADGKVEILNTNGKKDYPYLLARNPVIPPSGPYFLEVQYEYLSSGAVSFCLDYLPAEDPAERPLSQPFLYTFPTDQGLRARFATETKDLYITMPSGMKLKSQHVMRLEFDGDRQYRLISDGTELGRFESRRRPSRFWIGYPPDEGKNTVWGRIQVDYVEAGTLVTPSAATPRPSPTPTPSPDASASPAS